MGPCGLVEEHSSTCGAGSFARREWIRLPSLPSGTIIWCRGKTISFGAERKATNQPTRWFLHPTDGASNWSAVE